ncbi:THAP-type domain-containing protein [Aphis craccivora]|uniref:THAP-type domain-containing protein n=1 Tax=Aphis craccivora TaxID=307492 RepID=A0A6G0VNU7_APHCR|nr:THAP-type domain-containing protein [Aphis craccivora]
MQVCAFIDCYSGSTKIKSSNTKVHIYRFPKDSHMRDQWFEQIQKGSKETVNINFKTAAVCSLHFPPSSYLREQNKGTKHVKLYTHPWQKTKT